MSKFTVYADREHEYRWRLLSNDESVLAESGKAFERREDCIASVKRIQKEIPGATVVTEAAEARGPGSRGRQDAPTRPFPPAPEISEERPAARQAPPAAYPPSSRSRGPSPKGSSPEDRY